MATMQVTNRAGGAETIEKPLAPGRAAASGSRPVVLSSEDKTALDALVAALSGPKTATQSNVPASATAVTLIAANSNRKSGSNIKNDSTAVLYIKLGENASLTDYWESIDGKTTIAGSARIPDGYTGIVTGIWASATGAARVTEMT